MRLFEVGFAAMLLSQPAGQGASVTALLESGKYQEAVDSLASAEQPSPLDVFVGALASQRLQQHDRARELYERLRAGQGEDSLWAAVAASGSALVEGNAGGALEQAQRAVELGGAEFAAQYQLGAVLYQMERFGEASSAFSRASQIDPNFAYAHFYAGTAFQKDKRLDKTSEHFEAFLRLAPHAPEAPAVQSIMRTLRGR